MSDRRVGQGAYDRSRGNKRNWILVWEDGFCNFAASAAEINTGDCPGSSSVYRSSEFQHYQGLQPEIFFKLSHEIYNYGEGLIGKVAADHSHRWLYTEPNNQEINFLSAWHNSADSHPRTWEAQFQAGIKTIALIAVREGVVQLGAVHKVLSLSLTQAQILHALLSCLTENVFLIMLLKEAWYFPPGTIAPPPEFYDHFNQPMKITSSMSSLEALLSKLPSVVPPQASGYCESHPQSESQFLSSQRPVEYIEMEKVAKEETDEKNRPEQDMGESSSSISAYHRQQHYHQHQDQNVTSGRPNNGF
ncbi:hypothetical protein REPUB_Repub01dG0100300 [Reevesia pubescens]